MPVETGVLHRNDRLDQIVRDLPDRYGDPALYKKGAHRSSIVGEDPGNGGGFVGLETFHLGQVLRDGKDGAEKDPDEKGPGKGEGDPEAVFSGEGHRILFYLRSQFSDLKTVSFYHDCCSMETGLPSGDPFVANLLSVV
jgi:hypothetical protein